MLLEELEAFTRENAIGRRIGSSQFLEEVIVLEAAALLIGDDFPKCDEQEARQILKASARLGELAHPVIN